jgi:Tfp pilus assembly protein PilF
MTERGVRLFNQGRIQESIDQFTKAIALDANYIQAWAKRAEAYAMLGRGDQAAEDRRRLEALDAGSWSV